MTVILKSPYPQVLASNGLIESYREYAPSHKVASKTIEVEVAALLAKIESKPGFDPNLKFDPTKHIIFKPEDFKTTKQFTLDELNITKTHVPRMSDFGAAFPFPLLSQEAVDMILWESLQESVIEDFARLPNLATKATRLDFHVSGHSSKLAPFCKSIVESSDIEQIVSTFFGEPLEHIYNSECAHLNVSLATNDSEEKKKFPSTKEEIDAVLTKQNSGNKDDIPSSLGLHYDSTTATLVIMLDLPVEAVGGETTVITGNEKTLRVPEPRVGYATLIQGRVLRHLASKPVTNHNRIAFVNSYACKGSDKLDNTALTSTKPSVMPVARFDLFYRDWVEYKLSRLESHIKYVREGVVADYEADKGFDQPKFVEACIKMEKYLHGVYSEMECVHNPPFPPPLFSLPYEDLPLIE